MRALTHFCPPLRFRNQFLPTVPTFDVRETDVSRHNGGASGASLKPLRDDSALRALYRLWAVCINIIINILMSLNKKELNLLINMFAFREMYIFTGRIRWLRTTRRWARLTWACSARSGWSRLPSSISRSGRAGEPSPWKYTPNTSTSMSLPRCENNMSKNMNL